ncbi:MAG TPA: IS5 family transposase, partial [Trichocoleus sp.]
VSRQTFAAMVAALRPNLERRGKRGGQNTLSVENQLLLTLQYWREYRTQFHIGLAFGVSEATVSRTIAKVEELLAKSGQFRLPGKRELLTPDSNWDVVVVDVTEVAIERPQKKQRRYYSGKHKRHTLKGQLVIDLHSGTFIAVATGKGRTHDLKLWHQSEVKLAHEILCLADKGYQGIAKGHCNSITPKRKPPRRALAKEDKVSNRALASLRIRVEHSIRKLKRFRIFSSRYRNRRRRFGLRLHLLAGILNFEQSLAS